MVAKFIVLAALVACASAGFIQPAPILRAAPALALAPVAKTVITKVTDAEYDPHPQYQYSYDVADSLTGDFKAQTERRDGDLVQGSYSLLEADGTRRVVDYAADALNGFNAVVRKEPATLPVKTIAAAPVAVAPVAKVAAPLAAIRAPIPAAYPAAYPAAFPAAYPAAFPAAYPAGYPAATYPYPALTQYTAPLYPKTFF